MASMLHINGRVLALLLAIFIVDILWLNLSSLHRGVDPILSVVRTAPTPGTSKGQRGVAVNASNFNELRQRLSALHVEPSRWKTAEYTESALGIRHYTRERLQPPSSEADLLILVIIKDRESWGSDSAWVPRTFCSFLYMLHNASIDLSAVSLGILTPSLEEFNTYQTLTKHQPFARVSLILHPGYGDQEENRGDRHSNNVQRKRRGELARLRNYLMLQSLQREDKHVIWFDADVYQMTPGLIPAMLAHTADPKVGVITVRCNIGGGSDYDLNAWVGPRSSPNEEQKAQLALDSGSWIAGSEEGSKHMGDLVQGTRDDELVKLDAVGGTMLYLRASLVRQGLVLSVTYIVGTTWEREGWDGIETEGICTQARGLGAGCYGMGGKWETWHSTT